MTRKIFKPNLFDRLEKEGNDDFLLLNEFGPGQFETEHLLEMKKQAKLQLEIFGKKLRLLLVVGALSAGWIFLGLMLLYFRSTGLGLMSLGIGSVCLICFLVMTVVLYRNFGTRGEWEHVHRQIESELRHRASQTQNF